MESYIVCGAGDRGSTHNAGRDSLAGVLLHGATTGLHLLREGARHLMFNAAELRLGPVQPKVNRPAQQKEKTQ